MRVLLPLLAALLATGFAITLTMGLLSRQSIGEDDPFGDV